jgi:hypothetical protein
MSSGSSAASTPTTNASQRCYTAAGFHLIDPMPDQVNMLYFGREHPQHG